MAHYLSINKCSHKRLIINMNSCGAPQSHAADGVLPHLCNEYVFFQIHDDTSCLEVVSLDPLFPIDIRSFISRLNSLLHTCKIAVSEFSDDFQERVKVTYFHQPQIQQSFKDKQHRVGDHFNTLFNQTFFKQIIQQDITQN